jgi:hypothetical protein
VLGAGRKLAEYLLSWNLFTVKDVAAMRRSSSKFRLLMLAGLLASQAAGAAVPCVSPQAKAPEPRPPQLTDCRDVPPGGLRTGPCANGNQAQTTEPLLALDMPAPLPVLIVARAQDVADWHAEIFAHLGEDQPFAPAVRGNCSLLL